MWEIIILNYSLVLLLTRYLGFSSRLPMRVSIVQPNVPALAEDAQPALRGQELDNSLSDVQNLLDRKVLVILHARVDQRAKLALVDGEDAPRGSSHEELFVRFIIIHCLKYLPVNLMLQNL